MTNTLRILYFLFVVKPMLGVLIGLNVFNRHKLPPLTLGKPFILIANHNSHLDACTLLNLFSVWRIQYLHPVAASDYFMTNPVMAWVATCLMNIIPIPRTGITRTNNPVTLMGEKLAAGHSLIIFPEGSRGEPEVMSEFKTGVAHLIKKHPDVPVIPVFLKGMGKALPKGELVLVPFFCDVVVGDPLVLDAAQDKDEITRQLQAGVSGLQEEIERLYEVSGNALP